MTVANTLAYYSAEFIIIAVQFFLYMPLDFCVNVVLTAVLSKAFCAYISSCLLYQNGTTFFIYHLS